MKQSIIGEIYYAFSKQELKKLNKFIQTSSWNHSETIVNCHNVLSSYAAKNKLDKLSKDELYLRVYGNAGGYSDSKLRFTLNRLLDAIREFVLLDKNEEKNVYTEKVWMDYIQDKRLKKNILYNIENKYEPKNTHEKLIYNYFKSWLAGLYKFQFTNKVESKFNSLMDIVKTAEIFADFVFIRQYSLLLTFGNVYQSSEYDIAHSRYQNIKNKNWNDEYVELDVFIALIEMLITNEIPNYFSFKNKFLNHFSEFDNDDKVTLISYLLNFSTAQINKGNVAFIDEQYEIYTFIESSDIFLIPNFLNSTKINNVVHIYLRKKEFEKAEDFINKYVILLKEDLIDSCRHFNIARIRFENKLYKKSLRELLQVDFGRDTSYTVNSRFLLLKNYFELKESDALASLCTSFKEYIKKNKVLSETYKNSCLNFIKMVDKIYGCTLETAKKLEDEIKNTKQIAEKTWLLEKITEKLPKTEKA